MTSGSGTNFLSILSPLRANATCGVKMSLKGVTGKSDHTELIGVPRTFLYSQTLPGIGDDGPEGKQPCRRYTTKASSLLVDVVIHRRTLH